MAVANALAYYDRATITVVKSLIIQAPGLLKKVLTFKLLISSALSAMYMITNKLRYLYTSMNSL
jgi:hypothetical protein